MNKRAAAELARAAKAEGKKSDAPKTGATEKRDGHKTTKEAAKQAKVWELPTTAPRGKLASLIKSDARYKCVHFGHASEWAADVPTAFNVPLIEINFPDALATDDSQYTLHPDATSLKNTDHVFPDAFEN